MAKKSDRLRAEDWQALDHSEFDAEAREFLGNDRYEDLLRQKKTQSEIIEIMLAS